MAQRGTKVVCWLHEDWRAPQSTSAMPSWNRPVFCPGRAPMTEVDQPLRLQFAHSSTDCLQPRASGIADDGPLRARGRARLRDRLDEESPTATRCSSPARGGAGAERGQRRFVARVLRVQPAAMQERHRIRLSALLRRRPLDSIPESVMASPDPRPSVAPEAQGGPAGRPLRKRWEDLRRPFDMAEVRVQVFLCPSGSWSRTSRVAEWSAGRDRPASRAVPSTQLKMPSDDERRDAHVGQEVLGIRRKKTLEPVLPRTMSSSSGRSPRGSRHPSSRGSRRARLERCRQVWSLPPMPRSDTQAGVAGAGMRRKAAASFATFGITLCSIRLR